MVRAAIVVFLMGLASLNFVGTALAGDNNSNAADDTTMSIARLLATLALLLQAREKTVLGSDEAHVAYQYAIELW